MLPPTQYKFIIHLIFAEKALSKMSVCESFILGSKKIISFFEKYGYKAKKEALSKKSNMYGDSTQIDKTLLF